MNILNEVYNRFRAAKTVVVDVETSGLDWRHDHICGYVLTFGPNPIDSYYLPVRHAGGGNLPLSIIPKLKVALEQPDLKTIYFNASFDMRFLFREGIVPQGPLEDAQINAYLIDERQRSFNLEYSCEFANVQSKKGAALYEHLANLFGGEPTHLQMANFHKLAGDDPIAVDYATGDGTSTWQLWDAQQHQLDKQELRQVWDVECRLIRTLVRMMTRGIRIDEGRMDYVASLVKTKLADAMNRLPKDFNTRGPTDLKKFFSDAGLRWPLTEKGNASFPELWLKQSPQGRDVIIARQLRNLMDSYFTPLKERHIWNGRVHCQYNQTRGEEFGTITGRLSCSEPNLQQVHKRNKLLGPLFRSIFIPDPDHEWASVDYEQIEPRLLGHYGQVQVLLDGYRAKPTIDAHTSVMNDVNARGIVTIDREFAKRLNQAMLTGAGRRKVALMLELPQSESDQIVDAYFASMPEIKHIQKHASNVLIYRGYVKSLLGRRARLDDQRFAYKALNRLLQCGNADIIKKSMVEIDEYFLAEGDHTWMLNTIHDDLAFQYLQERRSEFTRALEIMRDYGPGKSIELELDMEVSVGTGRNWAEATYGIDTVRKSFTQMGGRYE